MKNMLMKHRFVFPALLFASLGLCACGDRHAAQHKAGQSDEALPAPESGTGSVTGMPDKPGPGEMSAVTGEPPPEAIPDESEVDPSNPETGLLPDDAEDADDNAQGDETASDAEPTPEDALAVVRDYYAAINARRYDQAYAFWAGDGSSSRQTSQQFANGFANTVSVAVEIQPPGEVDAAAGSRYIEIPVAISATRSDGSVHKYVGAYTLRRAMVDGATEAQRAWHLASADLREVKP